MNRKGRYTKRLSFRQWLKRGFRHQWKRFKGVSTKKKLLVIGGPIAAFLLVTPLLTYIYFARDISDPERLMNRSNTGIVLLDRHNKPFYSFGRAQHHTIVPLKQISDYTEKALLASEDKNFYHHSGFSIGSMLGALYANIISADPTAYGGSTLTQQLAKNTLLSSNQNFLRKYQELSIAIAIEQNYSKDEILELYLNSVYFGEGAFGIRDAARTYFNTTPQNLTLAQSALLIGVLPAPSAYSPITGSAKLAKERQNTVLSRMQKNGMITTAQQKAAAATKLSYAPPRDPLNNGAPHFAQMVLNELYERYGEEKVTRSGYQVATGLDLEWQKRATDAVAARLPYIQQGGGSNAGVVAIDPRNGQIRVLVGSVDWNNKDFGEVNMATTARQPGSSFKPIYYTEALRRRLITPATILKDQATTFEGGYAPHNYDFRFRGDITVRNALAQSLNIPAVEVMEKLGISNAVAAAKHMGISTLKNSNQYGLSLALGAAETKLVDMTNAYAAFAHQGNQFTPTAITRIKDKYDDTIYTANTQNKQVTSKEAAFLISDILSDDAARAPTFGSNLNIYGRDVAVKTGTTDDSRDAWTIGYTPQISVGVWVGNNDNRVMSAGGSGMAGPIWMNTLQAILEGVDNQPFTKPAGVEQLLICANGLRATKQGSGVFQEYFITGTGPTQSCTIPEAPRQEEPQTETPTEEEPTSDEETPPAETPEEPTTPSPSEDPETPTDPDAPVDNTNP